MKTTEEKKKWILQNCVDTKGNINLMDLDFTDFDGDVKLTRMRTKKSLDISQCEVGEHLLQSSQIVKGDIDQTDLIFGGRLFNYQPTDDDYIIEEETYVIIKQLKPITEKELKKLGYVLKKG